MGDAIVSLTAIGENEMIDSNEVKDVLSDIVSYNLAIDSTTVRRVSRRGKIQEMSKKSRRRYRAAMSSLRHMQGGHCVALGLTTTLKCPKEAKKLLKSWIAAMRYRHPTMCGVWNVEFQIMSYNVHYHVVLRIFEPMEIELVTRQCLELWATINPHYVRQANDCGRVRNWDALTEYLEKNKDNPECPQKLLPPHLHTGLGGKWWGVINQMKMKETSSSFASFPDVNGLNAA